jgi:PIN domain nuclease of toxin-antitoxin system
VTTLLLDSHVVHWWSAEPRRLSRAAARALEGAEELAVAAVSWYELAWLAENGRVAVSLPARAWLAELSGHVRTAPLTPAIAATAASLPEAFPSDPADRLIYATAIENGWRLVTKDRRLREHPHPRPLTLW